MLIYVRVSFFLFIILLLSFFFFFFFNDTATTEIYTLSLHDALPILKAGDRVQQGQKLFSLDDRDLQADLGVMRAALQADRKSTRLNSSHLVISYAVFCLKKKKKEQT